LVLFVYIKGRLYEKIQPLVNIIKKQALEFSPAQDMVCKQLTINRSSFVLYKLAQALALFPFLKSTKKPSDN
jgi:hypothetical protein